MKRKFILKLDNLEIGHTYFENADPPMGVVYGRIHFSNLGAPYGYFLDYCETRRIPINYNEPDQKLIATQDIPGLQVFNQDGVEIEGLATSIEGMESDGFNIEVIGIDSVDYQREFQDHLTNYENQFKVKKS